MQVDSACGSWLGDLDGRSLGLANLREVASIAGLICRGHWCVLLLLLFCLSCVVELWLSRQLSGQVGRGWLHGYKILYKCKHLMVIKLLVRFVRNKIELLVEWLKYWFDCNTSTIYMYEELSLQYHSSLEVLCLFSISNKRSNFIYDQIVVLWKIVFTNRYGPL